MKERDCRVKTCIDGECHGCKRKRADRRISEHQRFGRVSPRDLRELLAKHGLVDELRSQARHIVLMALADMTLDGDLVPAGAIDAIRQDREEDFDTASSASRQHWIDTGEFLRQSEMVDWF